MVVYSRTHLRVSSLWVFLFRRHTVFYPSRRFFANNSIYKKPTCFISFSAKSLGSLYVCHISYFLVAFERHFQGSITYLLLNITHLIFFSLIICIINNNVLSNFKCKGWNYHESIFNHRITFLILNSFISRCFFKKFDTNFLRLKSISVRKIF